MHLQSWTGIKGFFCLDKVWERTCLPSGHQQDHTDNSFVQLGRDYWPGPSLSAENSKVRELKRQVEQKVCEEQGQIQSETGPDSYPASRTLLRYKKHFCRQHIWVKICCLFHFRANKWDCSVLCTYKRKHSHLWHHFLPQQETERMFNSWDLLVKGQN